MTFLRPLAMALLLAVLSASALAQDAVPFSVSALDDLIPPDGDANRIRTQLVPRFDITLSSEVSATIADLSLRPGDSFQAGTALITFDCLLFEAQLAKAQASLAGANQAQAVVDRLVSLGSSGELEQAQARARSAEAEADSLYLRTMVDNCIITAPFDGRVTRRLARQYEYVTPGQPLLEIVDTGPLELQLLVPSQWVTWLENGKAFTVSVDETGTDITAEVVRISAAVDPASRSITITGALDEAHPDLLPGMSGWAQFDVPPSGEQ